MKRLRLIFNVILGLLILLLVARGLSGHADTLQAKLIYVLSWLPLFLALLFLNNAHWVTQEFAGRLASADVLVQAEESGKAADDSSVTTLPAFILLLQKLGSIPSFADAFNRILVRTRTLFGVDERGDEAARNTVPNAVGLHILGLIISAIMIIVLLDDLEKMLVITILIIDALLFAGLRHLESNPLRVSANTRNTAKLTWRLLPVAISLVLVIRFLPLVSSYWSQYGQFNGSAISTQATVMHQRYDSQTNKYFVIYHYSAVGQPGTDYVAQDQGNLAINSKVDIVYLAKNPLNSALVANSQLPFWPIGGLIVFAAIGLISLANRGAAVAGRIGIHLSRAGRFRQWFDSCDFFLSAVLISTTVTLLAVWFLMETEVGQWLSGAVTLVVFAGLVWILVLRPVVSAGLNAGSRSRDWLDKHPGVGLQARKTRNFFSLTLLGMAVGVSRGWGWLKASFSQFKATLSEAWRGLLRLTAVVAGLLLAGLHTVWKVNSNGVYVAGRILQRFVALVSGFLRTVWKLTTNMLSVVWRTVFHFLREVWVQFTNALSLIWRGLWYVVSMIVSVPLRFVRAVWVQFTNALSLVWRGVRYVVSMVVGVPLRFVRAAWVQFTTEVNIFWRGVRYIVSMMVGVPLRFVRAAWVQFTSALIRFWRGVLRIVRTAGVLITTKVSTFWRGLWHIASMMVGIPSRLLRAVWLQFTRTLSTTWRRVLRIVRAIWVLIATEVSMFWRTLVRVDDAVGRLASHWLDTVWGQATSTVSALWGGLRYVTTLLGMVVIRGLRAAWGQVTTTLTAISRALFGMAGIATHIMIRSVRSVTTLIISRLSVVLRGLLLIIGVGAGVLMHFLGRIWTQISIALSVVWRGLLHITRIVTRTVTRFMSAVSMSVGSVLSAALRSLLRVGDVVIGVPLRFLGTVWTLMLRGLSAALRGLLRVGGAVIGVPLRFFGTVWTLVLSGLNVALRSLLRVGDVVIGVPLRFLGTAWALMLRGLSAALRGLLRVGDVVIGVPLRFLGTVWTLMLSGLRAVSRSLSQTGQAAVSVSARWFVIVFRLINRAARLSWYVLVVSFCSSGLIVVIASADYYWRPYMQFDAAATGFVVNKRLDSSSDKYYVTYRFSEAAPPQSNYVAEDIGNAPVDSKIEVVYWSANPSISMLAANHQMPIKETVTIVLASIFFAVLVLDTILRFAWWIRVRPRWIGGYVGWFELQIHR